MVLCSPKENNWAPLFFSVISFLLLGYSLAFGDHRSGEGHVHRESGDSHDSDGQAIPGVSFQVFGKKDEALVEGLNISTMQQGEAIQTVVDAFTFMVKRRTTYQRFDEALSKNMLRKVIVEPKVFNRDGKEFLFLVARTEHKGQVKLLISASLLKAKGLIHDPGQLVPILAREFQWVVSKADTTKKRKGGAGNRDLRAASILSHSNIKQMSGQERRAALQSLLGNYLVTVDVFHSLNNQPYYDGGSSTTLQPSQADSTSKLYDIRVRQALQRIVMKPDFLEKTPRAVRSLLNGKIWNVSFAHIDSA